MYVYIYIHACVCVFVFACAVCIDVRTSTCLTFVLPQEVCSTWGWHLNDSHNVTGISLD